MASDTFPHGTRTGYVKGCRRECCRRPHREYNREHDRRRRNPDVWGPTTDLDPELVEAVRQAVTVFRAAGFGLRTIAAAAGVSRANLAEIMRGNAKRVRPSTVFAVWGVTMTDLARLAPSARVDATETLRLVDEMIAAGATRGSIAQALGAKTPALQIANGPGGRVHARTALAVFDLHERFWRGSPAMREACRCDPDLDLAARRRAHAAALTRDRRARRRRESLTESA